MYSFAQGGVAPSLETLSLVSWIVSSSRGVLDRLGGFVLDEKSLTGKYRWAWTFLVEGGKSRTLSENPENAAKEQNPRYHVTRLSTLLRISFVSLRIRRFVLVVIVG